MINSTRQQLLQVIAEISQFVPEVRLGQLVANLSSLARGPANGSVWDTEDEDMLEAARKHLERWQSRQNAPTAAGVELDIDPAPLPHASNP